MSKKDLARQHMSMKREMEQLKVVCKNDPLRKKNPEAHERLAELKKKLGM